MTISYTLQMLLLPLLFTQLLQQGSAFTLSSTTGRQAFALKNLHMTTHTPIDAASATNSTTGDAFRATASPSAVTKTNEKTNVQLQASPRKRKMPTEKGGPVTAIHSIDEFLAAVEDTQENELVIVKFHAKFCKVCARVILKYRKMANQQHAADTPVPIRFITIECTANMKIIQTLGIKKFPFFQIYRNRECVASFGTGPAHNFQRAVGGTVDQKMKTSVEEWESFRAEFQNEIASGLENLEMLRLQAMLENECYAEDGTNINSGGMNP